MLLLLVPSVVYLLYRAIQITHKPPEQIVGDLVNQIPPSPKVCVDSITQNCAIIHWDIESHDNLYYVLVVNKKRIATVSSTSCKLENLSDRLYEVVIVAINVANNFCSESAPVFLHPGQSNMAHILEIETRSHVAQKTFKPHLSVNPEDVPHMSSEELTECLVAFQNEIAKINAEYKSFQVTSQKEIDALTQVYNTCKKEYNEEHDTKVRKESTLKGLEKRKNDLSFEKSKAKNTLQQLQTQIAQYSDKTDDLRARVEKMHARNNSIAKDQEEKKKIGVKIQAVTKEVQAIKKKNDSLEESIKTVLNKKKSLSATIAKLKPLLNALYAGHKDDDDDLFIFLRDGSISPKALEALHKIFSMCPSWQDDIMKDIHYYQELDRKWRESYSYAIQKYVAAHNAVENARAEKGYEPARITEYQASIDFGGQENMLKGKFRKKDDVSSYYAHYGKVYEDNDSISAKSIHSGNLLNGQGMNIPMTSPINGQVSAINIPTVSMSGLGTSPINGLGSSTGSTFNHLSPPVNGVSLTPNSQTSLMNAYEAQSQTNQMPSLLAPSNGISSGSFLSQPFHSQSPAPLNPQVYDEGYADDSTRLYEEDLYENPQNVSNLLYYPLAQNLLPPGSSMWGHSVSSSTSSLQNKLSDYPSLHLRDSMSILGAKNQGMMNFSGNLHPNYAQNLDLRSSLSPQPVNSTLNNPNINNMNPNMNPNINNMNTNMNPNINNMNTNMNPNMNIGSMNKNMHPINIQPSVSINSGMAERPISPSLSPTPSHMSNFSYQGKVARGLWEDSSSPVWRDEKKDVDFLPFG